MGSYTNEKSKQHKHDSYCKRVLRNELFNHYNEEDYLKDREANFSELTTKELEQLSTKDEYFKFEYIFEVLGNEVIVKNEMIANALIELTERKKEIILLAYFLDLSDREIGENLNMIRSTVQSHRKKALTQLRRSIKKCKGEIK